MLKDDEWDHETVGVLKADATPENTLLLLKIKVGF